MLGVPAGTEIVRCPSCSVDFAVPGSSSSWETGIATVVTDEDMAGVCEAAQQCNCKLAVCCFFFALLLYIGVTLSTLVIFTGASCFLVCLIPMECVPLLIWAIFGWCNNRVPEAQKKQHQMAFTVGAGVFCAILLLYVLVAALGIVDDIWLG